MKKNQKKIILIIILVILLIIISYFIFKKDNIVPIDKDKNSDITSSKEETLSKREDIEKFLLDFAQKEYDKIVFDEKTVVILYLEDMEKIYGVNIDKYIGDEYKCHKTNTFLKVTPKDGKNTYSTVINCQDIDK